ncbi:MAG TPA: VOC family protein [Kofleriaceae bacterium]
MKLGKITANLIVPSIERCLAFYVDRIGFTKTVEVPHGDAIGFVILVHDGVELMLQSDASLAEDVPPAAKGSHRSVLYIEVPDLEAVKKALADVPRVVPDRTTAYGAHEVIVADPAGNTVFFAAH